MTNEKLIVWGIGTSRTMRVHWQLQELGIAYETRPIGPRSGETQEPAYQKINPKQKIPTLQHGTLISLRVLLSLLTCGTLPPTRNHTNSHTPLKIKPNISSGFRLF